MKVKKYSPSRVYLIENNGKEILLGNLVSHKLAEENGYPHACVYIILRNLSGQVFIQHRAGNKRLYPNLKTVSASGHVNHKENFEDAALREVHEELGIKPKKLKLIGFIIADCHGGPVYETDTRMPLKLNAKEICAEKSMWIQREKLKHLLYTNAGLFTPAGEKAFKIWINRGNCK